MRYSLRLATLGAGAMMFAGAASVARAQDSSSAPPPPPQGGQMHGGHMGPGGRRGGSPEMMLMHGITLTDAQKDSVGKLHAAMQAQMEALQKTYTANVRATLTSDQQAQFDKNVAEMQQREQQRWQGGQGGQGAPPPDAPPPQ